MGDDANPNDLGPIVAIEDLLNRMDDDTDKERDEDLDAFLRHAYPSAGAQNS